MAHPSIRPQPVSGRDPKPAFLEPNNGLYPTGYLVQVNTARYYAKKMTLQSLYVAVSDQFRKTGSRVPDQARPGPINPLRQY
jgi:hypothetical protein